MDNNDILRRLRYTFEFDDRQMIDLFAQGDCAVTREQVSDWLKRDDDPAFKGLKDLEMASFLNGLIVHRRGRRDGAHPVAETHLDNNIVLRKLKIALDLKDVDLLRLITLGGMTLGRPALSALFRKRGHKHYRECQDQILRKFLKGVQLEYHPTSSGNED